MNLNIYFKEINFNVKKLFVFLKHKDKNKIF